VSEGKWASGAWGSKGARTRGRGREVRDELTGGVGRTERERESEARMRKERRRQAWPTRQREGEGGEGMRGLAPTGGTRLSGTEGAGRGCVRRLGLMGQLGLNSLFYFPGNF
jgi:hypothetical protein